MYQLDSVGYVGPVGQVEPSLPGAMPVDAEMYTTIGTVWGWLYDQCRTRLSDEQCKALLGYRPIYTPEEQRSQLKTILIWLGIGFVAGKLL